MNILNILLRAALVLGLLLPVGAAAAEGVQRSTDEKGTIQIGNAPSAGKEKAGEVKAAEKVGEEQAKPEMAVPAGPPPGLNPPKSRRPYGPGAEARREAFERAHPDLIQAPPPTPTPPGQ